MYVSHSYLLLVKYLLACVYRDIDWETPSAGAQAAAFTELLSAIRDGLTQHATSKGDTVPYQLSVRNFLV